MSYREHALHLWSMTDGRPHPAVENPVTSYPRMMYATIFSRAITNSRLAIPVEHLDVASGRMESVVWEWRPGSILLVSELVASLIAPSPIKLFADEHSLVVLLDSGPGNSTQFSTLDTRQGAITKPIEISFYFSGHPGTWTKFLSLNLSDHTPSLDELTIARAILSASLPYISTNMG